MKLKLKARVNPVGLHSLGFYSIACASKSNGSLDNQSLMISARCIAHLRSLQKRFPALAVGEILEWPNRDLSLSVDYAESILDCDYG
jgi:hypothetical protein